MAKIIDLREYKKSLQEHKVIEVDFKTKSLKKVKSFKTKILKNQKPIPFKKEADEGSGNDIA